MSRPDRLGEHAEPIQELIHLRLHSGQGLLHAFDAVLHLLALGDDGGLDVGDGSENELLCLQERLFEVLPVLGQRLTQTVEGLALRFAQVFQGGDLEAVGQLGIGLDLAPEEEAHADDDDRIGGAGRLTEQPGQRLEVGPL